MKGADEVQNHRDSQCRSDDGVGECLTGHWDASERVDGFC